MIEPNGLPCFLGKKKWFVQNPVEEIFGSVYASGNRNTWSGVTGGR